MISGSNIILLTSIGVIAAFWGVQQNIYLFFSHVDGGQCSCACNLVREQLRNRCETYKVKGALAKVKRSHHSCISWDALFRQPNSTLSSQNTWL